ncbi:hypothetical protein PIB30_020819 [Stylosanthes scabra]|uniref:Uncharacterized protein n=1 Tax=Stylosanthes scabra TaxID=79078 RepID=A0ABU6T8H4_9FABA|nr:hypothetical protein [Stylosanthes scabra]
MKEKRFEEEDDLHFMPTRDMGTHEDDRKTLNIQQVEISNKQGSSDSTKCLFDDRCFEEAGFEDIILAKGLTENNGHDEDCRIPQFLSDGEILAKVKRNKRNSGIKKDRAVKKPHRRKTCQEEEAQGKQVCQ